MGDPGVRLRVGFYWCILLWERNHGKGIMKWWFPVLSCVCGFLFKASNYKWLCDS